MADGRSYGLWDIGWCLLYYFLVTTLDGAITLVEMNVIRMGITEDLDLDVSGSGYVFLD